MRFSFTFVFTIIAALLGAATGQAEQTVTLSPAVVPLQGSTGQSVTQLLTLRNDTDTALDFVLDAQDVVVRDGKRVFVEAGKLPDSIAASAVFTPQRLRIAPHASASATVTLTLPPEMRHRAAAVFFRSANSVQSGNRQAYLSLGALFTFTVSGQISIMSDVLRSDPPSASANARVHTLLKNDGKEPVLPGGMAVILDADGQLVGKAPFRAQRLLPGESTTLVAEYPGELRAGTYRTVATLDLAGQVRTLTGSLRVP